MEEEQNHRLYNAIYDTLVKESKILEFLVGQGIYFAPELAIAYLVGKELKLLEKEIFGEEVTWRRETKLGSGSGITDLYFESVSGKKFIFEFKISATHFSYQEDIVKLQRLKEDLNAANNQSDLFFVALVDTWRKDKGEDTRIITIEKENKEIQRVVDRFAHFEVSRQVYTADQDCTLAIWKIN